MRHAGKVVSKTMILGHVYDYAFDPGTNVVDVLVHRLRDKIDRDFEHKVLADRPRRRLRAACLSDTRRRRSSGRPGAFSLRLGLWYALVFLAGGALLLALTYAPPRGSLRERDRELVAAALEQYVGHYRRGGLGALSEAVATDRLAGRTEGVVVRITGAAGQAVFASVPGSWEALGFEVASGPPARRHPVRGGQELGSPCRHPGPLPCPGGPGFRRRGAARSRRSGASHALGPAAPAPADRGPRRHRAHGPGLDPSRGAQATAIPWTTSGASPTRCWTGSSRSSRG